MHLRWRMYRCMPYACNLLDEAYGIYCRTTSSSTQKRCLLKRLGRRLELQTINQKSLFPLFTFLWFVFYRHNRLVLFVRLCCPKEKFLCLVIELFPMSVRRLCQFDAKLINDLTDMGRLLMIVFII
jgi:hypothetical protein